MYQLLEAESRASKQMDKLSQLRRDGYVPGVIFGKGKESISVKISNSKFAKCMSSRSHILEIALGEVKHLVNVDSIQRDPVSGKVLHVSFHELQKGQETTITIPVVLHGLTSTGKGVVMQQLNEVDVIGMPQDIPNAIEANVAGLKIGDSLHLKDIPLPKGIRFDKDSLEEVVATCVAPVQEEDLKTAAPTTPTEVTGQSAAEPAAAPAAAGAEAPSKDKKE